MIVRQLSVVLGCEWIMQELVTVWALNLLLVEGLGSTAKNGVSTH